MGQLIVRGVDDRLIQALKERAARAGRAAEAEHRAILEAALRPPTEGFAEAAARLRARTGLQATDSAALVRADRDRTTPARRREARRHRRLGRREMGRRGGAQCPGSVGARPRSTTRARPLAAEAVNVLWAKVVRGDLAAPDAQERMALLARAPVIGAALPDLMPRAFAISLAHAVTIYDSLYVTLAEKLDIPMISADARLIRRLADDAGLAKRAVWVGDFVG
jgi:predicted nucleic acid-binding protein